MKVRRSLVARTRVDDRVRGHESVSGRIRLDRPLGAVLRRRLTDRSAERPLAFAPVVVWAAGVFTLFSVCYFTLQVARGVAGVARLEREEERQGMIGYVLGQAMERPDVDVHRVVNVIDQLAVGGRLIVPVGPPGGSQDLRVLEKLAGNSVERRSILKARFPPLIDDL